MSRALFRFLTLAALPFGALARQMPAQAQPDSGIFLSFKTVFWVRDVRQSVVFYRDSLGLPFVSYTVGQSQEISRDLQPSDPDPYAATFVVGDQRLVLQQAGGPVRVAGQRYIFEVAGPAAYSMRLKERGVRIEVIAGDSTSAVWFAVVDPDGRRLEFLGRSARR